VSGEFRGPRHDQLRRIGCEGKGPEIDQCGLLGWELVREPDGSRDLFLDLNGLRVPAVDAPECPKLRMRAELRERAGQHHFTRTLRALTKVAHKNHDGSGKYENGDRYAPEYHFLALRGRGHCRSIRSRRAKVGACSRNAFIYFVRASAARDERDLIMNEQAYY
jgi:hypothetical protein